MRFVTLHVEGGKLIYVNPERAGAISANGSGPTVVIVDGIVHWVSETPEEALRIVEGANPDGSAALVEAARRMVESLEDSGATHAAHETVVRDLRSALAAMEVPRG